VAKALAIALRTGRRRWALGAGLTIGKIAAQHHEPGARERSGQIEQDR
jgi:hypothetical protein